MRRMPLFVLLAMVVLLFACGGGPGDDDAASEPGAGDDAWQAGGTDARLTPMDMEFDPSVPGPFAVGNLTREFRDRDRWDVATRSERRLLVEIWYPAVATGEEVPTQLVADFLNGWDEFIVGILQLLTEPEDHDNFYRSVVTKRGIAPDRRGAPYPVVFFSHGNGGIRFQNWTMAEYLASHGYIVVSPDHTGNAVFVTFAEKVIVMNPLLMINAFFDRFHDVLFLLDTMEELTEADPQGWLTGLVDTERAAIVGHSFGGATVGEALRQDSRLLAGVNLNGPTFPWGSPDYGAAVMHFYGDEDRTMDDTRFLMDWSYEAAPPPKYRIDGPDCGHYSFTDACLLIPSLMGEGDGCGEGERIEGGEPFTFLPHDRAQAILDQYVTAFLGAHLSGYATHQAFLWENHFPDDIRYQYELP